MLVLWASFRFDNVEGFFESVHPAFALTFLGWVPLPFALAHVTAPGGWRDYEALFDNSWSIFVRSITAWSFTGLVWLVIFLSDQLLELVGFEYIGAAVEKLWFSMPLTGVLLGLALAVLNELTTVVSMLRRLVLQLLRLLLPMVAIVVGLFILLVPFQGFEKVFGSLSAAGTMLVMVAGAVTLITSAIDARDSDAAKSRLMVLSAKVLALLLPIISVIAVYAIWLRVGQYGWTPPRVSGAVISVVVFVYSLAYAISVARGAGWQGHIRQANTWMAVAVMGLSALWFTPLLNAERISASGHLDRFLSGRISVDDLDVWELGDYWGSAGKAALVEIREVTDHSEQTKLQEKLAHFDGGESRWHFGNAKDTSSALADRATLRKLMPVLPDDQVMPEEIFHVLPNITVGRILTSCKEELPDGRPGCVMVVGAFRQGPDELATVLFWRNEFDKGSEIVALEKTGQNAFDYSRTLAGIGGSLDQMPAEELIVKILDGGFSFVPARMNALEIDSVQLVPRR